MPEGPLGIIGVTVSPANPDRVWAIIEAEDGGVFRSDDAGATWEKLSSDRALRSALGTTRESSRILRTRIKST